jgi:hypothetical protein
MNRFSLLLLLLISAQLYGQNLLIIGEKSYPSTGKIILKLDCQMCSFIDDFSFVVAKNGDQGIISLSIELMDNDHNLSGDAIIYLANGEVIKLTDNANRDFVNQIASNTYALNSDQIFKLKTSDIYSIRFSIKCPKCVSSSVAGDYTASNTAKILTSQIITQLFSTK